jgi:hypothetical protein
VFLIMKSYKVRQVQMLPFSHLAHLALSLNLKIKLHVFILSNWVFLFICYWIMCWSCWSWSCFMFISYIEK